MAYAEHGPGARGKRLSLQWPLWRSGGMDLEGEQQRRLELQKRGQRGFGEEGRGEVWERRLGERGEVGVGGGGGGGERAERRRRRRGAGRGRGRGARDGVER